MKIDEIEDYQRFSYTSECDRCGTEHEILTQSNCCNEYYTDIYVQCLCGDYVQFRLPVN